MMEASQSRALNLRALGLRPRRQQRPPAHPQPLVGDAVERLLLARHRSPPTGIPQADLHAGPRIEEQRPPRHVPITFERAPIAGLHEFRTSDDRQCPPRSLAGPRGNTGVSLAWRPFGPSAEHRPGRRRLVGRAAQEIVVVFLFRSRDERCRGCSLTPCGRGWASAGRRPRPALSCPAAGPVPPARCRSATAAPYFRRAPGAAATGNGTCPSQA